MEKNKGSVIAVAIGALFAASVLGAPAFANDDKVAKRKAVFDHWTIERRAAAQPRDLVVDQRGLGYLRGTDGSLKPYGHRIEAQDQPAPRARPGGGTGDAQAPTIANMDPDGITIGSAYTFSATVTDNVGLKSVRFLVARDGGLSQSFTPSNSGGDTYSISLSGFSDGNWSWSVEAKDTAKGGGNLATAMATFTVDTAGGGGGGGGGGGVDVVTNAEWTGGGAVQTAAVRIYFEMPSNPRRKRWAGYVCSGTVISDNASGRSIILTAAHCVYDDANKAFARNVLFIPNQAGTSGSGTDTNCNNDPLGCWVADFGVVDVDWTTRTFPDNIPWDYAFYVVDDDPASHQGPGGDVLEQAAGALSIQYAAPAADDPANDGIGAPDYTHGMGYSYSDDPNFMYCAEDMENLDAANWWLPSCGLSGGSSGGPWIQPLNTGSGAGPVISVNSWGYTTSPGMAGPKLNGTSAQCVFEAAKGGAFRPNAADGNAGYDISCP